MSPLKLRISRLPMRATSHTHLIQICGHKHELWTSSPRNCLQCRITTSLIGPHILLTRPSVEQQCSVLNPSANMTFQASPRSVLSRSRCLLTWQGARTSLNSANRSDRTAAPSAGQLWVCCSFRSIKTTAPETAGVGGEQLTVQASGHMSNATASESLQQLSDCQIEHKGPAPCS
jgi:hypothetical protein